MEALRKKRGGYKSAATKLVQRLTTALEEKDETTLQVVKVQLQGKTEKIEELNDSIWDLMAKSATEEQLADEMVEADEWMEEIMAVRQRVQRFLSSSTSTSQGSSSATSRPTSSVKLPKLEIRKYEGGPLDWVRFWDQFQASVDQNPGITDIQRFTYLQSLLAGPAHAAIAGIPLSAANYQVAVDCLKSRFGQKELIVHAHMTRLLGMQPLSDANDVRALRHLFDECQTQIKSLEALGVTTDSYSCLLSPVLLKLLPETILIEWNRRPVASAFKAGELMQFLQQEVEGRERSSLMVDGRATARTVSQVKDSVVVEKRKWIAASPTSKALVVETVKPETKGENKKQPDSTCQFCDSSDHQTWLCVMDMEPTKRAEIIQKTGRCFQCLRWGHRALRCYKKKCELCNRKHHRLLCQGSVAAENKLSVVKAAEPDKVVPVTQSVMVIRQEAQPVVQMKVAQAWAEGPKGRARIRCLFDDGSHRSFIRADVVKCLQLPMVRSESLLVKGFGNLGSIRRRFAVVAVKLRSPINEHVTQDLELLVVPEIASTTHHEISDSTVRQLKALGLQQAIFGDWKSPREEIDVLLGLDLYWKMLTGKNFPLSDAMMASESKLGWILNGTTESTSQGTTSDLGLPVMLTVTSVYDSNAWISKCWDLDSIGIKDSGETKKPLSDTDIQVQKEFEKNIEFDGDRYSVHLPWKASLTKKETNKALARGRLYSLLRQFTKQPELFLQYRQAIMRYVEAGHAEEVDRSIQPTGVGYYLPHHAIIKEDRLTTKIRVVFDASSHEPNCRSLNDCLWTGPNLNPELVDLLLRFRSHEVAILADIQTAFLQVRLAVQDRDATRYLWVTEEWTPGKTPHLREFRMSSVLFGATSSPYLLAGTIRHHLKQNEDRFPQTCQELGRSLYVDDLATGRHSVDSGYRLCEEARTVLMDAGMPLMKWVSNSEELLDQLRVAWLSNSPSDELLIRSREEVHQVLGLNWNPASDTFALQMKSVMDLQPKVCKSKRKLLQCSARIFDPLGFVSPVVVSIRVLFQEAWELKIPWDDPLPPHIQKRFDVWLSEVPCLEELKVERYLGLSDTGHDAKRQLHVYCDASECGYGAVCYLRSEKTGKVSTTLLISKGRVAPLKRLTVPRLELLAALVGARLADYVQQSLGSLKMDIYLWTDSMVTLYWICSAARTWKPFVSNRVTEIQKLTSSACWRHCPGLDNPADLISRGCLPKKLLQTTTWWKGPPWLALSTEYWPERSVNEVDEPCQELVQAPVAVEETNPPIVPLVPLERFSSLTKLVRVTGWILRFVRRVQQKDHNTSSELTIEELEAAMSYWLHWLQRDRFKEEIKDLKSGKPYLSSHSKLRDLKPYLNKSGLLCLGGRLEWADVTSSEKHPIILPGDHVFTKMLVLQRHHRLLHAGVTETLSDLRADFWILKGRQTVKSVIRACQVCAKSRLKPGKVVEAPLPDVRANPSPPFQVSGIDYAGPLFVKDKNGGQCKTYILLFTCAVTRAVHLELMFDQTTSGFLMAFRRFVARRGLCRIIYSDNAKTFKSASRELRSLWKKFSCKLLQDFYSSHGIQWRFIAERAAWWGGFWERLVRTVKTHLKRVLGQAKLTYEELMTVLTEVESIVNSRPLTSITDDPQEMQPLTPSHFLIGERLSSLPDKSASLRETKGTELRRRWRHRQRLINQFWQRWVHEYLLQLRSVHQSRNVEQEFIPKVGDLVLVKENRVPRHLWPCGIVVQLIPGRDQKIRSCQIRMKTRGLIRRPIQLLFPLEM